LLRVELIEERQRGMAPGALGGFYRMGRRAFAGDPCAES
jgi:hypothetical protein